MTWYIFRIIGFLLGSLLGCFAGALAGAFQEYYSWTRDATFLVLIFGVSGTFFFIVAPVENKKIWAKLSTYDMPKERSDDPDFELAFPPIFFGFCLAMMAIPYAFADSILVEKMTLLVFGSY